MENVLVLGITAYKFPDETTGQIREGAHVHYVNDYTFDQADKKGFLVVKISVPLNVFTGVMNQKFPALCTMKSINLPNGKGQPKPTVTEINYGVYVDVFALSKAKA